MTRLPYIQHSCGKKIAWTERPWALVTHGPPSTVLALLDRIRGQRCPCGDSIPRTVVNHPSWTAGYYVEVSRRSWWRPWTWLREPYRMTDEERSNES